MRGLATFFIASNITKEKEMETSFFVRGLLIGFSIAAVVGRICLLCIHRTLHNGSLYGLVTGLGAATADAVYGGWHCRIWTHSDCDLPRQPTGIDSRDRWSVSRLPGHQDGSYQACRANCPG